MLAQLMGLFEEEAVGIILLSIGFHFDCLFGMNCCFHLPAAATVAAALVWVAAATVSVSDAAMVVRFGCLARSYTAGNGQQRRVLG